MRVYTVGKGKIYERMHLKETILRENAHSQEEFVIESQLTTEIVAAMIMIVDMTIKVVDATIEIFDNP